MREIQVKLIDGTPITHFSYTSKELNKLNSNHEKIYTLKDAVNKLYKNYKVIILFGNKCSSDKYEKWCIVERDKNGVWRKVHKVSEKLVKDYAKEGLFIANTKLCSKSIRIEMDRKHFKRTMRKSDSLNLLDNISNTNSSVSDTPKSNSEVHEESTGKKETTPRKNFFMQRSSLQKSKNTFKVTIGTNNYKIRNTSNLTFEKLRSKVSRHLDDRLKSEKFAFFAVLDEYEISVNESVLPEEYFKLGYSLSMHEDIFHKPTGKSDVNHQINWKPRIGSLRLKYVMNSINYFYYNFELTEKNLKNLTYLYLIGDPLFKATLLHQPWVKSIRKHKGARTKKNESPTRNNRSADDMIDRELKRKKLASNLNINQNILINEDTSSGKDSSNSGLLESSDNSEFHNSDEIQDIIIPRITFCDLDGPIITGGSHIKLFTEHIEKIRIKNESKETLTLKIYVRAVKDDFVGYKINKESLSPGEETNLFLYIVALSLPDTSGLLIISNLNSENDFQNYLIAYTFQVVCKDETMATPYFVIKPGELIQNDASILGHGTSSIVYESVIYGQVVASKVVKEYISLIDINMFQKEVEILSDPKLFHPGIIRFYGASDRRPFIIITEKMDFTLSSILCRKVKPVGSFLTVQYLDMKCRIRMIFRLASALNHLQMNGYVHRDVKSSNIMLYRIENTLDENKDYYVVAKLLDMGSSERIDPKKKMKGEVGTIPWMAPEISKGNYYDEKVDIYSFGIIMMEVFANYSILERGGVGIKLDDQKEIFESILDAFPMYTGVSNHLARVIHRCCSISPAERYTSAELCNEIFNILNTF